MGTLAMLLSGCPSSSGPDLLGCTCRCTISGSFATTPEVFPVGRACGVATGAGQNIAAACDRICTSKNTVCLVPPCPDPVVCSAITRTPPFTALVAGGTLTGGTFVPNGCTGARTGAPSPEGGDLGQLSAIVMPGSTLTIGDVRVAATGTVQATVGAGNIAFADIALDARGPHQVQGRSVSAGRAFLTTPTMGSFDAPDHYSVLAGRAFFALTALVDGRPIALRAVNTSALTGLYDDSQGLFTIDGTIEDVDRTTAGTASLVLGVQNWPPVARITAPTTVGCTGPGRAVARVSGAGSTDRNGAEDIVDHLWIVDRGTANEAAFSGVEVDLQLSLGHHEIQLFVRDRAGAMSGASHSVSAEDREGPVLEALTITPGCLWPPNHKLAHYRVGHEVQFVARDRCTPGGETVRVVEVRSSEAENGRGDGNTQPDSVVTVDGFCIRSVRSGLSKNGRRYEVDLEALDHLGNRSLTTTTVTTGVAHDQRGTTCDDVGVGFVDDGDPDCAKGAAGVGSAPDPGGPVRPTNQNAAGSRGLGCATVPVPTGALVLLLLLTRLRRRG